MPQTSRRAFLQAAAALGLSVTPMSALAGLLDRIFSRREAKPTSPITSNEDFYTTSYRSPPTIRINDWSLSVNGLVERPMVLAYDQFMAKPSITQVVTLECVGNTVAGEFISTAEWAGISLRSLLEECGAGAQAYDIVLHGADGFSDSIRYDRAMAGDVMIAHSMNGVRLPLGHGFPARAIVPGHYGMKSVQWLTKIEVVAHDYKGYYQQKGWTEEAVVKTMSRIDVPGHGSTVQGLHQKIEGLAFAGARGISHVEISADGGERWNVANLTPSLSPYAWRFWNYDWTVSAPGRHTLIVRATDGTGSLQTSVEQEPAPDGATGLHEITVTVEP
ncbi:MAG: molybdopterin-dependent oxidoreductase [Nitrospira sp.]|nr:molybdopterin-dependent oxidoreductase [Nitrospira sp.]